MGNIPSFPFSPHTREAGFVCYVSHFGSADTLNNPCIILIPERKRETETETETETERLDTDTRNFRANLYTCSLLKLSNTLSHQNNTK